MAKKGLLHVVAAPVATKKYGELPTYGKGFLIGRAIEADISINYNDTALYADGRVVNRDKSFSSGTITYGVDEFGDGTEASALEVEAKLTGGEYVPAGDGTAAQVYSGEAPAVNELGTGYIIPGEYPDNGGSYYETEWVYSVEFSGRGKSSAKTKEGSVSWNTPTVEGNVKPVPGCAPKKNISVKERFATESEAIAWLDGMAGITEESADSE
ncbi:MAG: hypothetical protein ACI4J7_06020 [Ruminiclostridium sp.]